MPSGSEDNQIDLIVQAVEKLIPKLPGVLRFRFRSTLLHIERAFSLLKIDREMASFRAITAEEEAATALIHCLQARRYAHANNFKPRDHRHKAAVMACVTAIRVNLGEMLKEFQLVFDFDNCRIDVKMPLSNFGVAGLEDYAIQFVEPLGIVHTRPGVAEARIFDDALKGLAENSSFDNIKSFVNSQANARNTLLYASDSSLPESKASLNSLITRRNRSLSLLILTIMVWQSKNQQPLVSQTILAFLSIISKLPDEDMMAK